MDCAFSVCLQVVDDCVLSVDNSADEIEEILCRYCFHFQEELMIVAVYLPTRYMTKDKMTRWTRQRCAFVDSDGVLHCSPGIRSFRLSI